MPIYIKESIIFCLNQVGVLLSYLNIILITKYFLLSSKLALPLNG